MGHKWIVLEMRLTGVRPPTGAAICLGSYHDVYGGEAAMDRPLEKNCPTDTESGGARVVWAAGHP
jgi:hypothetical protein